MTTKSDKSVIQDDQELRGAKNRWGSSIRTYDDGFGPLWIMRDSMGIVGIIRAQTWHDAYGIAEDELSPEAIETMEEIIAEYGPNWMEDACFQEGYGFRPNGPNHTDKIGHGIYSRDLNGESLDCLTREMLDQWGITLEIADSE